MAHGCRPDEVQEGESLLFTIAQKCTDHSIFQTVINFSQNACRERYQALQLGTAKPTPESVENPSPDILARIKSRRDKERRIVESTQFSVVEQKNVEANGWTSRMRTYF